jgi:DivIVA domain-containing protein
MTWFFAFLIVAVMGVVAVVASGRGGSMAETYDDRPDSRVQADGPLTAADLRSVRFSTAFRGYRMSEVDALLDRLAAELTPLPTGQTTETAPVSTPPGDEQGEPIVDERSAEAADQDEDDAAVPAPPDAPGTRDSLQPDDGRR